MTADEALRLPGRQFWAAKNMCGHDAGGGVREWTYEDCVVVLRHDGDLWRVTEVKDAVDPE